MEFLMGDRAQFPPSDASVFEHLLESNLLGDYVWAIPSTRTSVAYAVYAAAVVAAKQPLINRIHPIDFAELGPFLSSCDLESSLFICRSPDYGNPVSYSVYEKLCRNAACAGGNAFR